MGIVAFPNIPPQGPGARIDWELRTATARFPSSLTGYTRTLERPGGHFAASLRYENLNSAKAARWRAALTALRGQAQRFYLRDFGYTRRGSFPATELLTNNTFASGTSGWTSGTTRVVTASDGMLRVMREQHHNTADLVNANSLSAITVTQYAPYAARSIDHQGRSSLWSAGPQLGSVSGGEEYGRANAPGFGLKTLVAVLPATTAYFGIVDYDTGANVAGDYIEVSYTSLARCALVDNGANFFQRSDEIDNAYWTKNAVTAAANAGAAPDGATTADSITENGAAAQHNFVRTETRSSVAADWCAYGYFRRGSGTRNVGLVIYRDASNYARAIFDLGSGTIASAATAAGDTTNARAFIVNAGNGWYFCAVIGRLTATTSVGCQFEMASGTTVSYTGDTTSSLLCWRCGGAQTSVPTRGMQTTSAGDGDGVAQTGGALHLKGLPASTDGLLLADDLAEIITPSGSQFVRTIAPLNSDAAGLGYWQFEPPLRESPADGAAVIIGTPLMRAMLDDRNVRWSRRHAGFMDLEFTAVEDMTA